MASSHSSTDAAPDRMVVLSHLADQLLTREGGSVPVYRVAMRAADFIDISDTQAAAVIETGGDRGVFYLDRQNGEEVITGVTPEGALPEAVAEAFDVQPGDDADFTAFSPVDEPIATALTRAGYHSFQAVADADAASLGRDVEAELDGVVSTAAFGNIDVVTDTVADALEDAGLTTYRAVAAADPAELEGLTTTMTAAKAEALGEAATERATSVDQDTAQTIINEAAQHIPVGMHLAEQALARYQQRTDDGGGGTAQVYDITEIEQDVGDPIGLTDASRDARDPAAQYVSRLGPNEAAPEPTGLPTLDDPSHPDIPKAETHPDAGDDALPVDETDEVIPPAVPVEPRLQHPIDELLAKKLARGLVPVRLVGPRGCGKNYLVKYLCWQTNRAYVAIDADASTLPQDLFGPRTLDEDQMVVSRSGPVKSALLHGGTVVINEFPVMQAGAAMALHRLLNEGTLLLKAHGELVQPHPAARLVITMNPPTREYRDSEPMNAATRGRFRTLFMRYPQDVDAEVDTLDAQVNRHQQAIARATIRPIVQFAHQTRATETWPTLSTRKLIHVAEHVADGASPKAAVKATLHGSAEPNQHPEDAYDTLDDYL